MIINDWRYFERKQFNFNSIIDVLFVFDKNWIAICFSTIRIKTMYLKENETFLDYKVVKLEYEDRYKEIYTGIVFCFIFIIVIEKAKHKKEKSLVFIKKCQKKNTCNLDAFDMKDCLIQCVPTCSYRASHCTIGSVR